jgi:hypothetical protein
MRRDVLATAFAFAVLVGAPAQAALNISTQPTQNVICSGGSCTATNSIAFLNVNDLTTMLAAGDVTVFTGTISNDIKVEAAINWASATRLTLDAHRSIEFKRSVTVAGTGGALTLVTNDNGGNGGDYWFDNSANVTFWDTTSSLVINGQNFTLVKDIATLATAIAANLSGAFALAANYDASADGTYAQAPITFVNGAVDGLGNAISHLSIRDSGHSYVGLFAQAGGVVRDLRLIAPHVTGYDFVGALAGASGATMAHDDVHGGAVVAVAQFGGETSYAGGFAGTNGGVIAQSTSSARVSGRAASGANVTGGGLVGENDGTISQSSASGDVTGARVAGGLAGASDDGTIVQSHASGSVTYSGKFAGLGGLVGEESGTIANSYATGPVTGGDSACAGGLVASAYGGSITGSSAFGRVTVGNTTPGSDAEAGGLVCSSDATIDSSFATGGVAGGNASVLGGLVGTSIGTTMRSYATGSMTDSSGWGVGGLVGYRKNAPVQQVYAVGAVPNGAGGLIGRNPNNPGATTAAFWDVDTSGTDQGCGSSAKDCTGVVGLSDSQLKSSLPDGFDPAYWGQSPSINNGYPYLLANPPPPARAASARAR